MTPYYEHGGITIYHGDCREILPALSRESVHLLITDPPYGQAYSRHDPRGLALLKGDESPEAAGRLLHEALVMALPLLRKRRHAYIFGRFDFTGLPLRGVVELIWDKVSHTGGDVTAPWAACHEPITFGVYAAGKYDEKHGTGDLAARLRKGSVIRVLRDCSGGIREHPTEKPVRLLRELIESSSRIDEIVIDPFMGAGSTLRASLVEGRKAIGIEIEERYCEIAAKRLAQEVLPLEQVI